jgi:flagellar hook assembly protein FlgD
LRAGSAIALNVSERGSVRIDVYDVLGRRVRALVDRELGVGRHEIIWDGRGDHGTSLTAGAYYFRAALDGRVITKKAVFVQ